MRKKNNLNHSDCSMTDSLGCPISEHQNSLITNGGKMTLHEGVQLIDKLAHFNRERIPERVVHAKGAGAFGVFTTYKSMKEYTCADFLQNPNQSTNVFVRFSTTGGSKGSADTVRDIRGFAVKFYTCQGIYDIVGNHVPVFFIRDARKFPELVHASKPAPNSNLRNIEHFWDFISYTPESTHVIAWLYSDIGIVSSYSKMNGYGVDTFIWVNAAGERRYIKYHWKSLQGVESISKQKAAELVASSPDFAAWQLFQDIASGSYPRYELCVQMMCENDVSNLDYDPLDATKTWSETDFPLYTVGIMTLNRNPENFFAQVEQSAFCPGSLVPGIELSADKLLQGRSFAYADAQRYRLGVNYTQLPVNRSCSSICNNQRDGLMTYHCETEPVNYSPNSLNHNRPHPVTLRLSSSSNPEGTIAPTPAIKQDDFYQAGQFYLNLSEDERLRLCENVASELSQCRKDIVDRVALNFGKACPEWGLQLQRKVRELR